MALESKTIPVLFSGGLDSKTAEQLVVPGKFLVLENCVRRKTGRIEKRNGFTRLGTSIVGGGTIADGRKLAKLGDDLVLITSDKLYSYSTANDNWVDKGNISSVTVSASSVIRNSFKQSMPDVSTIRNISVSAWEDSRGGIRCSAFDDSTGAALFYDQVVSASGNRPKVLGINDHFLIFYYEAGSFLCKRINAASPTSFVSGTPTTVATGMTDYPYDVTSAGEYGVFIINRATDMLLGYVDDAGNPGSILNSLPPSVGVPYTGLNCVSVELDLPNERIYVMHYSSTGANANEVRVTAYKNTLLVSSSVSAITLSGIRNITGVIKDSDDSLLLFCERSTIQMVLSARVLFDNTTTTVVQAIAPFQIGVGLASKAFARNGRQFVGLVFDSPLQATFFTARDDAFLVSKFFVGLSDGYTKDPAGSVKPGLPRIQLDAAGNPYSVFTTKGKVQADADLKIATAAKGISKVVLNFGDASFQSAELGKNLIISSGIAFAYDGVSATELGFHTYPEVAAPSVSAGGGSFPAIDGGSDIYYYRVIYEWVDAQGQIHRSAPSVTVSGTITATTDKLTLIIPTLMLTQKSPQAGRGGAKIVVFRSTRDQASVLYRLAEIDNDVTIPQITYIDTNADGTNLNTREVLYTTGGVIENIAPPASTALVRHKNRVFLVGLENSGEILYSKEFVSGEGVAFSDTFTWPVDASGGGVKAAASLDDKLILFKKTQMFGLVGDGPLETGAQNDFSIPQQIAGDIGCDNPSSIVSTPDGLMFQSGKGIYLLTRSLGFEYVGADVERYNHLRITSAVVLEALNEVRFTTETGECLVYNYFFKQWSTFTNYVANHAVTALNSYLHLKSDGRIMKEDSGYLDNGARIKMAIETSWLAMNQIQGYQRLYEYEFLGDFISNHVTRVKLAYDYENSFIQTVYYNAGDALLLDTYGDDVTYGSSTVYGGEGSSVYQFMSSPRRQKCNAVKFRIEDIDTITPAGGASFNLVSLALVVGAKTGLNKVGKSKEV